MDLTVVRQLPRTLYSAVLMELFERLAYYGMVLVLGIWVVEHLGIPADRYGWVYGLFTGALYLLPLLAGALADRFGYKPALAIAFATLTAGYLVLGAATSFGWLCVALGLIAVGGSIVKPTISGTVTRTTVEGSTRPVGFGLYYMMINAGGLIGPVIAAQVRNRTEFRYVFWVSAAACALMLAQALLAFREPVTRDERAAGKRLGRVFAEIFMVLGNWRFVLLLVIFSGFWGMINVLFGFMPLYVESFTDLTAVEESIDRIVPVTRWAGHWLNPEVFISLDSLLIVLFQATVSYLTRRWRTVSALLVGTTIATVSWILPTMSAAAAFIAAGIVVWSIGETTCSARFFQYCGSIAPSDQVAVYLGYSFLALFLGNLYSGPWAGWLYQRFIQGPLDAGATPAPLPFFAGVMLMGTISVVGLALYRALVAPAVEHREAPTSA
ncbi:MAG TPA: MFS transporter [Thermoanaerobaculales bacterium]|nr:MFS transporter [Thermoanaerobaculales bacterium]HPA79192.1 MFS transporter [Thermoanaerobaculales bacterium]HQL29139.1 MFS transporter [Thermoanaerobaculales bacterium]HQN95061.1 MFS transporter [Thermoanaerobaculales bacterium]HQP42230.1 MFS transporter [Thermoanaerobaculales bacterium]